MASSVIDLDALYPNWHANGLTWIAFGNFSQTDIEGLKIQWFPKDAERRGRLQDIWTRHHDRQQAGQHPPPPVQQFGIPFKIDDIPKASLWLHGKTIKNEAEKGNAVAITANRALSALHGRIVENSPVELIDSRGKKRKATVILSRFIEKEVDMALIQLNVDETPFESFIGVRREAVSLGQQLALVGLATNSRDETTIYFSACQVVLIDACAIFHTICYTAHETLPGSALIVSVDTGGFHVVGVHVGTRDDTPPIKRSKTGGHHTTTQSVKENTESLHGHTAAYLICEVARVPDILSALDDVAESKSEEKLIS
eukprot:gene42723-56789_t